jgi:hypothetical protein
MNLNLLYKNEFPCLDWTNESPDIIDIAFCTVNQYYAISFGQKYLYGDNVMVFSYENHQPIFKINFKATDDVRLDFSRDGTYLSKYEL